MKQRILNTSQIAGMYTNNLFIRLLIKGHTRLCKAVNAVNDIQMVFHNFLMKKFKSNKSLDLSNKRLL